MSPPSRGRPPRRRRSTLTSRRRFLLRRTFPALRVQYLNGVASEEEYVGHAYRRVRRERAQHELPTRWPQRVSKCRRHLSMEQAYLTKTRARLQNRVGDLFTAVQDSLAREKRRGAYTWYALTPQRFASRGGKANAARSTVCAAEELEFGQMVLLCGLGHLVCRECLVREVQHRLSSGRPRVLCIGDSACGRELELGRLAQAGLPPALLTQLRQAQEHGQLAAAGLGDDLVRCSHCDSVYEMAADVQATELHCIACSHATCRRCGRSAHRDGRVCPEADALSKVRRDLEEARTAAVARACVSCKTPFVKEHGCNRMVCPVCGQRQWFVPPPHAAQRRMLLTVRRNSYLCREALPSGYAHFARGPCRLLDNTPRRDARRANKAAKAAFAAFRRDHPDVMQGDVDVRVSRDVRRAELAEIGHLADLDRDDESGSDLESGSDADGVFDDDDDIDGAGDHADPPAAALGDRPHVQGFEGDRNGAPVGGPGPADPRAARRLRRGAAPEQAILVED